MNIRFLRHQQIDKKQWDALIEESQQGQVYALSWYLDVVSPLWEALVQLDEQGKYKVVMPLPCLKKLNFKYLQQPLFCQQLGVFNKVGKVSDQTYKEFLTSLKRKFNLIINYQFNTDNTLPQEFHLAHTYTLYLNLSKPYAQLQQHYTHDRKLNLKRAHRAGLQVQESDTIEPLISFFRSETAPRIYGGVSDDAYDILRRLYVILKERGLAKLLYSVDAQGRKNAGCLFIIWRNRIVYIFNAAAAHGRKLNGRTLMLDFMIQAYAGQDYIFDFESPDDREPDIVRFYKSFGPETMPIQMLQYNHLPKPIKLIRNLRMQLVKILKR
jgi:hypothetical protein